jgi:hypothetical protein
MEILMPEPQLFFCDSDEEHFFAWLNGIDAVREVIGTSVGLRLTIDSPVDKGDFYRLIGLFSRYNLNCTCLRLLCIQHPDSWFRDSKHYWYKSVFG